MNTTNQVAAFNFATQGASGEANTHNIRVVTIGDQPWFVAKDVCDVLGLRGYASKHLKNLGQDERVVISRGSDIKNGRPLNALFPAGSPTPSISLISESGFYKLTMQSDKPQAKEFQNYVTKEILPSIRKTGSFVTGQPSLVENPTMSKTALARAQMTAMQAIYEALEEQERVQAEQAKTQHRSASEMRSIRYPISYITN